MRRLTLQLGAMFAVAIVACWSLARLSTQPLSLGPAPPESPKLQWTPPQLSKLSPAPGQRPDFPLPGALAGANFSVEVAAVAVFRGETG
jgi:hypothetical protein